MYSHEFCFQWDDVSGMSFETVGNFVIFPNVGDCCS